ncbi:hypothetical protein [Ilyobacter polytropus]|uniref:Uncharacterized protein n=1 Tax=Ilyobacter polytropus (strain ATCC 51220 / DSM 2926 / LMG 16218 / CuHBu1) TaxID=572544 RepID=E3HBD6_ILYPC|nr:hypothetical protein [Ilyobacter polytropus]ADO83751.1 hypothetical protein Ilyop_1980 [Ilyobacter polytropus DSM 2926]
MNRKINPKNYIPKYRILCFCKTCKFNRLREFCTYHQEVVNVDGCSAWKEKTQV